MNHRNVGAEAANPNARSERPVVVYRRRQDGLHHAPALDDADVGVEAEVWMLAQEIGLIAQSRLAAVQRDGIRFTRHPIRGRRYPA